MFCHQYKVVLALYRNMADVLEGVELLDFGSGRRVAITVSLDFLISRRVVWVSFAPINIHVVCLVGAVQSHRVGIQGFQAPSRQDNYSYKPLGSRSPVSRRWSGGNVQSAALQIHRACNPTARLVGP